MSLVVSVFTKTTSQKPEMLKKKCFPWDLPVVFCCSLPLKLSFLLSWRCYWEAWRICWCYHYSHLRCLEGFPWIVANINKSRYFIDQNRKFFCQLCSECILLSKRDVASVKTEFVTCNKKWLQMLWIQHIGKIMNWKRLNFLDNYIVRKLETENAI